MSEDSAFVGREAELEWLIDAIGPAQAARCPVVDIVGESGIGKTRLLGELDQRAHDAARLVVRADAIDAERDMPLALALQVAAEVTAAVGREQLMERVARDPRERIVHLLSAGAGQVPPPSAGGERDMDHRALVALLDAAASLRPLLVLIDDAHWADPLSAEWLAVLAGHRTTRPLLVVVGRRPHPAIPAFEEAVPHGRVDLGPLDPDVAVRMIDPRVPAPARRRIAELAGGNPFHVDALARSALEGRPQRPWSELRDDADEVAIPSVVVDALQAELSALDDEARLVAYAAAVVGDPFTADHVPAVAELSAPAAQTALERLVAADLVRPLPGGRYRFRHPIVHRAVDGTAPGAWRIAAHRRAERSLAAAGAAAPLRARHLLHAAEPGDAAAIDVLIEAAASVRARAPGVAARLLASARELLPPDAGERLRIVTLMEIDALYADCRFAPARAALETARTSVADAQDNLDGQFAAMAAVLDAQQGNSGGARSEIEDGLIRAGDGPARVQLRLAGAFAGWMAGDWAWARGHAAAALEAADSPTQRLYAAALGAVTCAAAADTSAARELADEAERLATGYLPEARAALVTEDGIWLLSGLFWLAFAHHELGRYSDSTARASQALELARDSGYEHPRVELRFLLAVSALARGELESGRAAARETAEYARLLDVPAFVEWTLGLCCWAEHWCGELDAAREAGEALERRLGDRHPAPPVGAGLCALAETRLDGGDPRTAADRLLTVAGGPKLERLQPVHATWAYRVLTRCALAQGEVDEARAFAEAARRAADSRGLPRDRAEALEAQAACALIADRDPARAADLAGSAADAADHPFQQIRARLALGEALAAAGDIHAAAAELRRAHRHARSIGAQRLRDRAAAELRTLGVAVAAAPARREAGGSLAALSEREREIAYLVRRRLTNQEIADRLLLSRKTVERHLTRAMRKLGVSRRSELARLVEESDAGA